MIAFAAHTSRIAALVAALFASPSAQAIDPLRGLLVEPGSAGLGFVVRSSESPYVGAGQRNDLVPLYLYEGERIFLHASRGGVKLLNDGRTRVEVFLDYRFEGFPYDRIPPSLAGMQARGPSADLGLSARYRTTAGMRPLSSQVGVLPRVHGSAMFQRGDTQNIALVTLGPTKEAQDMDGLTGGATSKSFILHYNFPPFSVGEAGRFIGPGRREIGHGALAERSLVPILPPEDVFPYSIRVVSEIMASNGSTSMASICGGCLALMDAGVPIIAPVAGISCGLMTEMDSNGGITKWTTITDILGEEDHFGDMDFKIAGTTKGITGFQLDLKINGLPFEIAKAAVHQCREARVEILKSMLASLPAPRKDLSQYAPRIQTIQIDPEKIGLLIGPGGKTIRRITETTGAQIDIADDDSGKVFIYSNNADAMNRAVQEIDALCGGGSQIEIGKIYTGRVTGTKEFGAFVECMPGKEGLVHISELADFRVRRTEDVVKVGDSITVKCVGIDERSGKVRLSRKAAMAELEAQKQQAGGGEAAPAEAAAPVQS